MLTILQFQIFSFNFQSHFISEKRIYGACRYSRAGSHDRYIATHLEYLIDGSGMTDITQSLGPGPMPASSSETLIQWSETSVQSSQRKIQRDSVFFRQNASLDAHATTKEFLGNLAKRKITVTCLQTEWRIFFVITQCVLIGVWRKLTLKINWSKILKKCYPYLQKPQFCKVHVRSCNSLKTTPFFSIPGKFGQFIIKYGQIYLMTFSHGHVY